MKIKREDWEALNRKVRDLETDLKHTREATLMQISTGRVFVSIVVPQILRHLGLEAQHGHDQLFPVGQTSRSDGEENNG